MRGLGRLECRLRERCIELLCGSVQDFHGHAEAGIVVVLGIPNPGLFLRRGVADIGTLHVADRMLGVVQLVGDEVVGDLRCSAQHGAAPEQDAVWRQHFHGDTVHVRQAYDGIELVQVGRLAMPSRFFELGGVPPGPTRYVTCGAVGGVACLQWDASTE